MPGRACNLLVQSDDGSAHGGDRMAIAMSGRLGGMYFWLEWSEEQLMVGMSTTPWSKTT